MTLFAFLGIWWATVAAGVGAVAIPVVIHLINRRRFKIVPWAAMKFLLAAQKQTRKRMRIEQLLLLLVRMAILACILIAMAAVMPWAEQVWAFLHITKIGLANTQRTQRIHHIFVLDASLSTNQKVNGEENAFEAARQMALKKIASNPSGDGYSVLILKDSPTWLVGEASQNSRKVIDAIKEAKPSHGTAAVATAYGMIAAKLAEAQGRFPAQAVYFFTDMQRSTWTSGAPSTSDLRPEDGGKERNAYLDIMERKATTIFVDCGPNKDAGNFAVTDLEFDLTSALYVTTGMDFTLKATVSNFSADAKEGLRGEVLIGKAKESANDAPMQMRVIDTDVLSIPAHETRQFRFEKVSFPKAGTYVVQVKIPDDALNEDNTRAIVITVRDEIPVLLVNGKASADRFERATEYLQLALNPFEKGREPKGFPLRPKFASPGDFSRMSEADLEKYDCIYWCDVDSFGANEVRKLDAHLRRGGGFVIALGDLAAAKLDRYNDVLYNGGQGVLPAKLMKKIKAPPEHHFYLQNSDAGAFTKAPLRAFSADADQLTLRSARFQQYVLAEIPEGKARAVLSFTPEFANVGKGKRDDTLPVNAPAIIEWNPPYARGQAQEPVAHLPAGRGDRQLARYRGKVILMTTSANTDWTSWPASPSYGAMMHELTRLAVSGRLREQNQNVGTVLEAFLPGSQEVDVTVHLPNKTNVPKVKTQSFEEINLFRWPTSNAHDTDLSGLYRVETSKGLELPFAVNVPTGAIGKGSESDLSRIDQNGLRDLYSGWELSVVKSALDAVLTGSGEERPEVGVRLPVGPEIANYLLLFVVFLLFAEIVLAWLFGHYTTTEGAQSNAPAGPASTTFAAGIAILTTGFFLIWATIKFHEKWTGDFLGFVPEILRTYFEKVVGAEPLQAGEGSRWEYTELPMFLGIPGNETWYLVFLSIAAVGLILFTYRAEAPRVSLLYKLLLGAVRLNLILFVMWAILPRPELHYNREGFPDLGIVIDDSRSMGESDAYQDAAVADRVRKLGEGIKAKLLGDATKKGEIATRIDAIEKQIDAKLPNIQKDPEVKLEVDALRQRLNYWMKQRDLLRDDKWRPSRLQLAQAILEQPEPHWLKTLLTRHKTKVHIFHLDAQGRAIKLRDADGEAGDLIDQNDPRPVERANRAITRLEPVGNDSRLGVALKQVIDNYRGSGLSSVIMFTDGVTTRDETIVDAGAYAAQRGVSLFFVGIGDELELRDLKLTDMSVEPQIYLGDNAVIGVRLVGKGYKDLTVDVVFMVEENGKEKVLKRISQKVDPSGQSTKLQFQDTPTKLGQRKYIIQVEPPKADPNDKAIPSKNLRQERTIEVIDTKQINVLYVEGQPRYEFRYLKFLMEREAPDEKKKKKSIDLKVLLLDADPDWHVTDKTGLKDFPPSLKDLNAYDVVIFGDCDPTHPKLQPHLKDIQNYVLGNNEKGVKATKPGGGILFMAGALNNPHKYKGTPLEMLLPVDTDAQPREMPRTDRLHPKLTPEGIQHPIFRFRPDPGESLSVFTKLQPMYWSSSGYKAKPAAAVLMVHPIEKTTGKPNRNLGEELAGQHPLAVQQFLGSGRSMFFGFDETWRWRMKEDEPKFNRFWIETMRYLSRARPTQTTLTLDRQLAYLPGEPIKIEVTFPDVSPGGNQPGPKVNEKEGVKVTVSYRPPDAVDGKDPKADPEVYTLQLSKSGNSQTKFEGAWSRTREGKYTIRLTEPDVAKHQPDGKKPSAEATVELPPGELDRLRMNYQDMQEAAAKSRGEFYTVAKANDLLDRLPPGQQTAIASNLPPTLLWNQWWLFALIVVLITSEWVLRKMKHLL